ncbi:hypothetical protein CV093_04430 [Oceanobacillus sp. 143]|nr:hypothetical protein CV093_04430 [Oceanobacillus sp. 143]
MNDSSIEKDSQDLWEIILVEISNYISKSSFDTWIAPSSGEITEGNTLVITAANDFACDWIKERYKQLFFDVLKELTGQEFK